MHFYPVAAELVSNHRRRLVREAEGRRLAAGVRRARRVRRGRG